MPSYDVVKDAPAKVDAQAVVVFAADGGSACELGQDAVALGKDLRVDLAAELAALHVDGAVGKVARIPTRGRAAAPLVMVAGLGKRPDLQALRRACAAAARAAGKDRSLAVVVPADLVDGAADERAQAVVEGIGLGAYAFADYRTKQREVTGPERCLLVPGKGLKGAALKDGVAAGEVLVRATTLARDLVNEPPAGKRPPQLAERAMAVAKEAKVKVKVRDERALADGGFGGILGVGQGSSAPPRLVELTYAPARAKTHVVLVGKGITFDTGGLSLKPTASMTTMKMDMAGAAAVLATLTAVAGLGLRIKVTGLLALAENMVSGDAIRVSDVLTHRNGRTVEVLNTDAEGRLVLADALAYGAESQPDVMIDIATLTGAQVVALGSRITGLMGSDDGVCTALEEAAAATGESVWRLPLPPEYREHLDSQVADLKNIGKGREAGTLVAGLFLQEFTDGRPWAHLDIAGPAWEDSGDGMLHGKGATGVGVRLLTRYLASLAA